MAQLPPKIPNMTPNWPDVMVHQRMPAAVLAINGGTTTSSSSQHHQNNPSWPWVDEFLDYSSARRGTHRRSVSDVSIAFMEAPMLDDEECRNGDHSKTDNHEFDKYDDEQFMSMFKDVDVMPKNNAVAAAPCRVSSSNPSTPSDIDQNNVDDDDDDHEDQKQQHIIKNEPDVVQSQCKKAASTPNNATTNSNSSDRISDPKRVKRILANRQSAQRSRVRKLQYISELERSVTSLQAEVSVLSPRVAFLDHQRLLLKVDNSTLKQRIAAMAQDKIFKDAHQEALKREIERLRQVYNQQNQKMKNNAAGADSPPRAADDVKASAEEEQLLNVLS